MARKYDLISELYNRTCKTVVSSPENWQAFLTSACRNYKLRFDEQLLVFAQRPDATAVLEIERWNKSFGRWVNKGAMGEIKTLTAYRTHLRNEIRKVNIDDDSLSTAKLKISAISEKLSELRKDVRLCDAIAERSDAMKENLEAVLADEEKIKGKENRSYEQRR